MYFSRARGGHPERQNLRPAERGPGRPWTCLVSLHISVPLWLRSACPAFSACSSEHGVTRSSRPPRSFLEGWAAGFKAVSSAAPCRDAESPRRGPVWIPPVGIVSYGQKHAVVFADMTLVHLSRAQTC